MNLELLRPSSQNATPWSSLKNEMLDMLNRFSKDDDTLVGTNAEFVPSIEVKDTGKSYQICAEVPGMDQKDINVSLRDNCLILEGEKRKEVKNEDERSGTYHSEISYGRFYRAIPLTDDIDPEKIHATYKDGVLMVDIVKNPERAIRSRKIEINAGTKAQQKLETKH